MDLKVFKSFYGLISNPATKDMKIKSYESLLFGTFFDKNSSTINIKDIEEYSRKNGLQDPSHLILHEVIDQLSDNNFIRKDNRETIILVNDIFLEKFKKQKENNEDKTKHSIK